MLLPVVTYNWVGKNLGTRGLLIPEMIFQLVLTVIKKYFEMGKPYINARFH